MHVVVTGANRGIGLELVRQLHARGDRVEAGARDPERADALRQLGVRVHRLDVTRDDEIAALAAALEGEAIDVVINCAGVYGGSHQSLRDLDYGEAMRTFDINALGALRVARALLPHVRRGTAKKLLHVTSGMGSIEDNRSGGYYGYRMAKAALNMMSRSLAVDLRGGVLRDQPGLGADRHGRPERADAGGRLGARDPARARPRDARRLRPVPRLQGRPLPLVATRRRARCRARRAAGTAAYDGRRARGPRR